MDQKPAIATSFLPDFCAGRLVFVVILLAELLAMVLTLAQPQPLNTPDRLYELGMYSMFIQWVALTCVTSLCIARRILNSLWVFWRRPGVTLLPC